MQAIDLTVLISVYKDPQSDQVLAQTHLDRDLKISEIVQMIVNDFGEPHNFRLDVTIAHDHVA